MSRTGSETIIARCLLAACICTVFLAQPALAQGGPADLWQNFRDELLSSNISAVYAASDGSMWFGSEAGANRYDGAWTALSAADGLPPGRVRAIAETADRALWFGTEIGGLARRAPDGTCCTVWTSEDGLPGNDVRALLPVLTPSDDVAASVPRLWIATAHGLAYLEGDHVAQVPGFPAVPVWALEWGPDGALLAGTEGSGIWIQDGERWRPLAGQEPLDQAVYALRLANDGTIWAGTARGLIYYADGNWQPFPLSPDEAPEMVFAIYQDGDGGFWLATDQGCYYDYDSLPETPPVQLLAQDGLANDYVRAMAPGPSRGLWFGTIAGVSRYAGDIWQRVWEPPLTNQRINAVLTDSAGRTWAGTDGHGLAMWDGVVWRVYTEASGLQDGRIVALFEDDKGRIWAGTGTGAGYWQASTGDGYWHYFTVADGVPAVPVWTIGQDSAGDMWFGTESGASRWNEIEGFRPVVELAGQRVNAIYRSADGALWVGTQAGGLLRKNEAGWTTITGENGPQFQSVVVNGISGNASILWVGSYDAGLWRHTISSGTEPGEWRQLSEGLPSPHLLAVSWAGGSAWVGSRGGLTRMDGMTFQSYASPALPRPEVSAIAPGTNGDFWIGTYGGLIHYRPETEAPWVRVASVNLMEPKDGAVTLDAGQPLGIRVDAGDTGTRSEHLRFLTQLEGVDGAPHVHLNGFITYEDLRLTPGTFTLRVWARDGDFNYSEPAELTITVRQPDPSVKLAGGLTVPASLFYPVFVLGLLAAGGLAAAGSVSWRSYRREKQRAEAVAARRQEAIARHFNPYISGEPVRDPGMFFGRRDLLHKILNALHNNSIMIHGERRIGKTTLLLRLAQELRATKDPEWMFIPVSIDLEGTSQQDFFHWLMENIAGTAQIYLPQIPPLRYDSTLAADYTDRDFAADLRLLLSELRDVAAPRRLRVILLMDEMDVVNSYPSIVQQQLRRIFMSTLAENLGAVVAGIQISKAWDRVESPWYNLFNELVVEPFSDEDARRLLVEPVQGVYDWEDEAITFVLGQAGGRPYRVQQYGLEAINHMLAEGRQRVTLADVHVAHRAIEPGRAGEVSA